VVRQAFYLDMAAMDLTEHLREAINVPTLIACGTRDLVLPLARSRWLAQRIPHARLEVVPDAGHMLPCEAPDHVAHLLEELAAGTRARHGTRHGL
jgi:pimeloyl-ACP methyl ester carboxylesterase